MAEYSTAPPPQNPTTNYTMTDQLDSPRVITNALGEVTSRRDFKPFGEEIAPESSYRTTARKYGITDGIRQKFTGYQKDTETGLDFAEARMYQNLHGRFTAVDPLLASGKSANPQTFNRFVYVMNNPIALIDPTGEIPGDYYSREDGSYLGNDEINDGKVYFADFHRIDPTTKKVQVKNWEETTIEKVNQLRFGSNSPITQSQAETVLNTYTFEFKSISERANYYGSFQRQFSNGTRWAGAASDVAEDVDKLTGTLPWLLGYSNNELIGFANTGNRMIFEDVFPKLGGLKMGGPLTPQNAYNWDALTLSQEQTMIQPLYENLTKASFDKLVFNVRQESWLTFLANPNSKPFSQDRDLMNISHRWEFGMKAMGYDVTPNQMPNPGIQYTSGEMYNRFNPSRPVGPIVVRFRF